MRNTFDAPSHALGFWHVPGSEGVMTASAPGCPGAALSDAERFHGAVACQRVPGNRDPDADPQFGSAEQLRAQAVATPVIACRLR